MNIQSFIDRKRAAGAREHEGNKTDWAGWDYQQCWTAVAGELLDACAYCEHIREIGTKEDNNQLIREADEMIAYLTKALQQFGWNHLEAACQEAEQEAEVSDKQNIDTIQKQVTEWAKNNFGADRPAYQRLLGAVEEVGELAHAHLKQEQNIRVNEDHEADAKDAIGDIVIYLLDYCSIRGWNFGEILHTTWEHARQRDWVNNNETGEVKQEAENG